MMRFLYLNTLLFLILFLISCEVDSIIPSSSSGVKQGQKSFQNGHWDDAIASFTQAIKDDSSDSRAYIGLAKSLTQKVTLNVLIANIIIKEPTQNPTEEKNSVKIILTQKLSDLSQYLGVLPQINDLLNTFYLRDTAGKMDNIIDFKQYSVDFVSTSFLSLFIVPQNIDFNGVIDVLDTIKISPILNEFKESLTDVHKRIISQVDTLVKNAFLSGEDSTMILERVRGINTFLELTSIQAKKFSNSLTILSATVGDSNLISNLLEFRNEINEMANTLAYYPFFDGKDNDGDGAIDEELLDNIDNDGDGYIDEDTRFPENPQVPPISSDF